MDAVRLITVPGTNLVFTHHGSKERSKVNRDEAFR